MNERAIEIRERIRDDRVHYRDSILTLRESHIVMNALQALEAYEKENAELKSSLTHANEECLKWHERAQNLLKDSGGSILGYEKKISDLQAENVALRERLEKAVELPCKIGDTVYEVYDKCDGHNCPYNGYSGQWRCHYEGERRCEPFIKITQFDYCDIPFVNDTVFVPREAAEARCKKLKEKNNDVRRI